MDFKLSRGAGTKESTVKKLRLSPPHLGKVQAVNKMNHLLQCGINHLLAAADHPESQDRALPKLLITAFGHRDIELMGNSRLDSLQNSSFAFEGVVLGKNQVQLENPHDHEKLARRRTNSYYQWSVAEAWEASEVERAEVRRLVTGTCS